MHLCRYCGLVALMGQCLIVGTGNAQQSRSILIHAGKQDWPAAPLFVAIEGLNPAIGYTLTSAGGSTMPAQADDNGRLWWWSPGMKKGETLACNLTSTAREPNSGVRVEKATDQCLNVRIGQQLFTALHFEDGVPRPYLYPLMATTGEAVTRNWPMKEIAGESQDHPHHRSLWTAYGDVRRDGKEPLHNYWDDKSQARQKVTRITRTISGPVFGQIQAEVDWIADDGTRDLTDSRTYTFFVGDHHQRVLDVRIVFHFPDHDITFADTKEGGVIALRMAHGLDEASGGRMFNSAGKSGEKDCWGQPANWCDYVGKLKDKTLGVAVLDHPANPYHPARWHIRGYGLYAANPFAIRSFDNKARDGSKSYRKGETATFNYRVIIHQGDTIEAAIAALWDSFAQPPKIDVQ